MTTDTPDWAAIERMPEFRALVRAKRAFIIPACLFFVVYYFALPALVGYWPDLMSTRVGALIIFAYLFGLRHSPLAGGRLAATFRALRLSDGWVVGGLEREVEL